MSCPPPPLNFGLIPLPVHTLDTGLVLLRSHSSGRGAIYFNKPPAGVIDGRYRFDAPAEEFGVLYAAETFEVCFAETVLRELPANTPGNLDVCLREDMIASRSVARLQLLDQIKLVDFVGGLIQCRANNSITTDYPYNVPNDWSLGVHSHPDEVDGIYYRSRFTGDPAVALFDRASKKISQIDTTPMFGWKELGATLKRNRIRLISFGANPFI